MPDRSYLKAALTAFSMLLCTMAVSSSATAAQTITPKCAATELGPNVIFNLDHAVKADGVITRWGTTISLAHPLSSPFDLRLKVLRAGADDKWLVTGESALQTATNGVNIFAARIPVKSGDLLGSWAAFVEDESGSPYCGRADASKFFFNADTFDDVPVGSEISPSYEEPGQVENSISAVIEGDVDGDGFGDESQDLCPQSAKFQVACPAARTAARTKLSGASAIFHFGAPGEGTVSASAKVKLPKSGKKKARTIAFKAGPLATVAGSPAKLKLKYPTALKQALKKLSSKKSLKLTVTLTSVSIAETKTRTYSLKLKGKKPVKKKSKR